MPARNHIAALALAAALAASGAARGDSVEPPGPLDERSKAQLARAVGNADSGVGGRLATVLTAEQIAVAMYRGSRAERLAALEAAGHLEDPWPILPYLAASLRVQERSAASQAAASLEGALGRLMARPDAAGEVPARQAAQLSRTLLSVAGDDRVALDLRAVALAAIRTLAGISGAPHAPGDALLRSKEPAIASAAMALLSPPLAEGDLASLAGIAESSEDPLLRGQAVGALCENALYHKVPKPSDDLAALIRGVFDNALPGAALLPAVACLGRFPAEGRAGLIDLALAHPDPAVKRFWDASSR